MLVPLLIAAVVGYFLGALPFGYIVARAKGINIFEHGSKSPGATNVRRVCGKGPGNLVFALDALKGVLAAGWPFFWRSVELAAMGGETHSVNEGFHLFIIFPVAGVVGVFAALIGHSFSCFTRFKGGKGVATAAGGFLVLMPYALLVGLAVWLLTFYSTRYVSLASMLAAIALPISAFFLKQPPVLWGVATLIAVIVVLRHRANIGRLLNGTENKFVKKPATPANS